MKKRNFQELLYSYSKLAKGLIVNNHSLCSATLAHSVLMVLPVTGVIIINSNEANAQIYHKTGVNQTFSGSSTSKTLALSGTIGASIKFYCSSGYIKLNGMTDHVEHAANQNFVEKLASGAIISNGNVGRVLPDDKFAQNGATVTIWNGTDVLGFWGFKKNGKLGWMKVEYTSTTNPHKIKILEYAYNQVSGEPITAGQTLLPVELTTFRAIAQTDAIRLQWATASEINNAGFELQRSEDGTTFHTIDWVDGHGNTAEVKEYFYEDKALRKGQTYYYRLKQIDYDGKFKYSDVVGETIPSELVGVGEFYPNPTSLGLVIVDFNMEEPGEWNVVIFDIAGEAIFTSKQFVDAEQSQLQLDLSKLAEGVYFVKFDNGQERHYRKVVVD